MSNAILVPGCPHKDEHYDPKCPNNSEDHFTIGPDFPARTAGTTVFVSADDHAGVTKTVDILRRMARGLAFSEYTDKGHFLLGSMHSTGFPELLEAVLRMAGALPDRQDIRTFTGGFEITSLVGTASINGVHLHMAISDAEGNSFGGHLKEGAIVHPTAEIVIGEEEQAVYTRELDEEAGFPELVIKDSLE